VELLLLLARSVADRDGQGTAALTRRLMWR
jgi:hypothetical protein